jgi:hypothetical protein
MNDYALGFISNIDLFECTKATVLQYRSIIDLNAFQQNIIDPIKLTFDSKIYNRTIEDTIESEVIRQLDKSNSNHLGHFHQRIFNHFGNDWTVPAHGYDIENETGKIYVELKNKHNTMNSSSSQKTYMRMQNTIIKDPSARCLLVEVIAARSQDRVWATRLDGYPVSDERIRRVSIDKFYEIVTGDPFAFKKLCEVLPTVISDAVQSIGRNHLVKNTVIEEIKNMYPTELLENIYKISFGTYQGFNRFGFR